MEGTIDQLNFEVLIKDDQFKQKVDADIALAKELNVQLSTLLDLQSKMPKMKIPSGASSDSTAAIKRAKDEEALARAISAKIVADEKAKKAIADREAAESKAVAALGKLEEADNKVAKSASDAAAAAERAAKATTERVTAEVNAETALIKKGTAEKQALKEYVKLAEAEERKAEAAAKRQKAETDAAAAISKKATEEQRARKETAKAAEAEEKAAKAIADKEAAQSRAAKASAQAAKAQEQLKDAMERSNRAATSQSRLFGELKSMLMTYFSIRGASQLVQSLVRVTGEFELQRTALSAMLGDLDKAKLLVADIQSLAVKSPFTFKELTSYTKQLAAFSVPAEELFETTKMLADVSAGLGVGMDRLVLAYGQIRSAAFLRGQEVRQLTEAGIPILQLLAKEFERVEGKAVSAGEVFDKISARLVPFEMVAKVFKDMTSEGGKFYEMQEMQAETLTGKISNLKDAFEIMLSEIGEGQNERIKGVVDWVKRLIQDYEDTGRTLVELVAAYGTYRTALLLTTNVQSTFARNLVVLRNNMRKMTSVLSSNPYVAIAAGATAAIGVIYKLGKEMSRQSAIAESMSESQRKYEEDLSKSVIALDALKAKLELATEGSKEYNSAVSAILRNYAPYIEQLKEEGVQVDNLADIYDNLRQKVEESVRARFLAFARKDLDATYAQQIADIISGTGEAAIYNLQRAVDEIGLNDAEAVILRMFVSGSTTWEEVTEKYADLAAKVDEAYVSLGAGSSGPMKAKEYLDILKGRITNVTDEYTLAISAIEEFVDATTELVTPPPPDPDPDPSPENPELEKLKAQIDMIKKLKQAYEELRAFLDDDQMRRVLKSLFPDAQDAWLENFDFYKLLLEKAEEMKEYEGKAASSLRDSIGGERAKDLADFFEAFMKYKEAVDEWKSEDFNFYGGDEVGKILRDLGKEYESIEKKRRDTLELLRKAEAGDAEAIALLRETLGEEVWKKYVTEGKKAIEELATAERDVAYKEAEDKAREKASEMLKRRMEEENIDLTDFADKSIAQVRTLLDRLGKLKADIEAEIASLEEGGLTEDEKIRLAELTEELELLGKQAADTGEELEKKTGNALAKIAKQTSETFVDLGKELADLGKTIGNDNLVAFGEQLSEISALTGSLAGKIHDLSKEVKGTDFTSFKELGEAAQGGVISIMVEAALYLYKSWKNAIIEYIEYQDTLIEKQYEYRDLMREISREEFTNIFGTDEMGLAAENARILNEAQEKYNKTLDEFNKKARIYKTGGGYSFKKITAADLLGDISEVQGWDLYLDNGNLNIDAIEMYYDTFRKRLTRKQRKLVEELIENGKALDDAAAQQAQYLTDLFSGVADNIADSMVEAFIESGNAAIDMGEIMSDVAKTMVADLIKSMFIKDILDKYQEDLKKITSDESKDLDQKTTEALGVLDTALGEIEASTPKIQEIIAKYFDYLGAGEESEDDKTLGAGIKGITEDTANLLASYLNAIRADVSYARAIWERMDVSMQQIAAALAGFSAPSLMEYQAKIESNTYNTMEATRSILSHLRSVIDYESSSPAIRVS